MDKIEETADENESEKILLILLILSKPALFMRSPPIEIPLR